MTTPKDDAGQAVRSNPLLDAGDVPPSTQEYVVVWAHKHTTLTFGDVVVMVESPQLQNLLLRPSDMTLHKLTDGYGQYVHLEKRSNNADERRQSRTAPSAGSAGGP